VSALGVSSEEDGWEGLIGSFFLIGWVGSKIVGREGEKREDVEKERRSETVNSDSCKIQGEKMAQGLTGLEGKKERRSEKLEVTLALFVVLLIFYPSFLPARLVHIARFTMYRERGIE
jgi:hypothetical protein